MKLTFDPSVWHSCEGHNWRTCSRGVNCYSYVLNRPDYHWSVPGLGFAHTTTQHYYESFRAHFTGVSQAEYRKQLVAGAKRDGLLKVPKPAERNGYYVVALYFPSEPDNLDFHWFRKDDNGTWSHKDGWHHTTNKDKHGKLIRNPSDVAKARYPVFGGYFLVPHSGVRLMEDFPLLPTSSQ